MSQAPAGATRQRAAFTLLELLAVIAILSLLAALVLGVGRRAGEAGRVARAKTELAVLAAALENYRGLYGDYPTTDDAARLLQSLLGRRGPSGVAISDRALIDLARFTPGGSRDPFTDPATVLVDPWVQPYLYVYRTPSAGWVNPGVVLYSIGPDGRDSPVLLPGGIVDSSPPENADNLYANRN